MYTTEDIKQLFIEKYKNGDFRETKSGVKTIELQGVQFVADKDYILREPNYDYAKREIEWYESMSLNVYDIPGNVPKIWKDVADVNGNINSNYGWMVFSEANGSQYQNCLWNLKNDYTTRQAVMIYNRPSMQQDWNKNHMHDFCCTFSTQCFLNKIEECNNTHVNEHFELNYIVYQRSQDSVFGYDNDILWHKYVQQKLANDLKEHYGCAIVCKPIICNVGSLHVYERHFKFLEDTANS